MPVTTWNSTFVDGKEYLVIEAAQFRVPMEWDPSSNMFIAVAAPDGGLGNFPALVRGDDGLTPDLDTTISFTALAHDDATPDSASWTELSANLYRLNLALHNGAPGDPAAFDLADADDLTGTITAGNVIVANSGATGFEYAAEKVGDEFWPASINNTPSGNPAYTLCVVNVPAQGFDWRPEVSGWCVITGTGSDVRVDLVARLADAASGNIMGRGRAQSGENTEGFATVLTSGPPAGSVDAYNVVSQGSAAVIYLRAERTSGSNSFTTTGTDTHFNVKVRPVP